MQVICLKENLKSAVDGALRIVKHNSSLPILNNLLIEAEKGRLKISSTDLEMGFVSRTPSQVVKEGKIAVPAQVFGQFINNLPNQNIDFEVKNQKLFLKCGEIGATLNGLNPEDFPIIPKVKKDYALIINSETLKNAVGSVVNSSAVSGARPEISSVYMAIEPDRIKFVATDSFRLAHKIIFLESEEMQDKIKINYSTSRNIIIPLRTAAEILRIAGEKNSDISISVDQNQILFDTGDASLVSRLVEGVYPDYEAIIPKSFETNCYVSKSRLEEAVKLSGCFSSKLNEVSLKTGSSRLEVFSDNGEIGAHKSNIPAEVTGEDVNITFNWKYLLDGLKNISEDEIILQFNGNQKSAVIKPAKNGDCFYILMPIKNI